MFKDKDNMVSRRVWQLVRIYKTRDGRAFYIVQNRVTGLYRRLNIEQAVALSKSGASYNFTFRKAYSNDKWLIGSINNHSISFIDSTAPYIEQRYTPLYIITKSGKPSQVIMIDEDFDAKIKMSIVEMRKLFAAGQVNFVKKDSHGYLEYPKEVMRYDENGEIILSAEQKRYIEKCEAAQREAENEKEESLFLNVDANQPFKRFNKQGKDFHELSDKEKEELIAKEVKQKKAKEERENKKKRKARSEKGNMSVEDLTSKAFSKAEADGTFDYVPEEDEDKHSDAFLRGKDYAKGTFDWALNEAIKSNGELF